MTAKGEGGRNGVDLEFGVNRYKLLHLGWIRNEVLLYSTGNCVQSSGMEYKKKNIYMSVHVFVCVPAIQQKLIVHCKSTVI